jgi:hypothetical protein
MFMATFKDYFMPNVYQFSCSGGCMRGEGRGREGKKLLHRRVWEDNIKLDLQKI